MDKMQKLTEVLQELRTAALSINSEVDLKATMHKYDMLFLGEKFNSINTVELHHCLQNVFGYGISKEEFLKLIPTACESLGMKADAMVLAKDTSTLAGYFIYLF